MRTEEPQTIFLKDYRPPSHAIERTELEIALDGEATRVKARLTIKANGGPGDLLLSER